jgi:predicted nuclease of restriction endonuclease-like (RecB) superfamily
MSIKKFSNDSLFDLVGEIKAIVEGSRKSISKDVNIQLLKTYWEIGKQIVQKEKSENIDSKSSNALILELSKLLSNQIGKGFSRSNLFNMRKFYLSFRDVQTLSGQLSWSHYCELLIVSDDDKRSFYEKECQNSGWSVRELKRQLNSSYYERLLLSKGKEAKSAIVKLAQDGQKLQDPSDLIKDPYVFEFLGIQENKPILENELEHKLIRHIEDFLLELGKGFMYVGSQQRITVNNIHHYVDMVFYNKILKSYVLIDIKTRKLKAADAGQMNLYLNYYQTEINDTADNPPIGIILCAEKDEIVVEYALGGMNNHIFASRYIYYLPDKDQLIKEIEAVLHEK